MLQLIGFHLLEFCKSKYCVNFMSDVAKAIDYFTPFFVWVEVNNQIVCVIFLLQF